MRVAAGALALVVAVLALALARDVRARSDAFAAGDARFVSGGRASWHADTVLPAAVSRSALGVRDDEELREALRLFRAAYGSRARIGPGEDVQAARAAAENALTPIAARSDRRVAARANDLLGLLAADDTSPGPPGGPSSLERALTSFRAAVRLDPSNAAARWNLELARRLLVARGQRPGAGGGTGPRAGGPRGAGAGQEGTGY